MMPKLLAALDFRSNNGSHRPLIDALERVRAAEGEGRQYFSCDEVPPSLEAVRSELGRRWPMTGLLDILKEADLRIRFTDAFTTSATREATGREEVRRRLLLCLYGLGTNAGLRRLAVGDHGFSHKELLHTRRHYIDGESLRDATRRVVNATLAIRDSGALGRGHHCLRGRLQALRRLRPEPHDRVARPLRRARRHDLLACRARFGVHPLEPEALLVVRGGVDDRGRAAARHRRRDRPRLRRQPRTVRGCICLLQAARFSAPAAAEGYRRPAPLPARGRHASATIRTSTAS